MSKTVNYNTVSTATLPTGVYLTKICDGNRLILVNKVSAQ